MRFNHTHQLRLRDTRAHAMRNVLGNEYLIKNLILAVEVHCHKVQGMTEAFSDSIIPGKFI